MYTHTHDTVINCGKIYDIVMNCRKIYTWLGESVHIDWG